MKYKHFTEKDLFKQLIKEGLKRKLIYEGLIFSYPASMVYRKLKDKGYDIIYKNKVLTIKFDLSSDNEKRYSELKSFMDICGWQHGSTIGGNKLHPDKLSFFEVTNGSVGLQYEPKFDLELSKNPAMLYHLTSASKLSKILKKGLVPKSSDNFYSFTDRIYLSKEIKQLYPFTKKKFDITKEKKLVILEVHPKRIRLFEDPNFLGGLYTLENIDKWLIKPIKEIELDDSGNIIKINDLNTNN